MQTAIDPMSDRPAYKQIADAIRNAVNSGELAPGAKVPSEAELVRMFGVAQGTVRNALTQLRGEGLLRAEHGKGVFVRDRPPMQRKASNRGGSACCGRGRSIRRGRRAVRRCRPAQRRGRP